MTEQPDPTKSVPDECEPAENQDQKVRATGWRKHLPNQLTMLRLVLAALFFFSISQFHYIPTEPEAFLQAPQKSTMNTVFFFISMFLFLMAVLTDFADGYLARRWGAESSFGRIMDPFCDKLLIIGAFVYLIGPRFAFTATEAASVVAAHPVTDAAAWKAYFGLFHVRNNMVTGVFPWMVIIILGRELLVTSVRGEMERAGIQFGANWFGKWKMVLQSVAIPVVMTIVWLDPFTSDWLVYLRDVIVWATVIATVGSGLPYLIGAFKVMSADKPT